MSHLQVITRAHPELSVCLPTQLLLGWPGTWPWAVLGGLLPAALPAACFGHTHNCFFIRAFLPQPWCLCSVLPLPGILYPTPLLSPGPSWIKSFVHTTVKCIFVKPIFTTTLSWSKSFMALWLKSNPGFLPWDSRLCPTGLFTSSRGVNVSHFSRSPWPCGQTHGGLSRPCSPWWRD